MKLRALLLLPALAACDKTSVPLDAVYGASDLADFQSAYSVVAISPSSIILPGSGTATYTGQFGGSPSGGGSLLGDVGITADFGGSSVSGTLSNINVFDGSAPDQLLDGSVAFTGTITGTTLAASGSGDLTIVDGTRSTGTATATLSGQFRDFLSFTDAISGSLDLDASAIGVSASGLSFYAR